MVNREVSNQGKQDSINRSDARNGLRNAVASTMANIIEHILHPLDLIRIRLQSHDGKATGNIVPRYERISTAFTTIFKEEGLRGLYKGLVITLVATNISKFLYFGLYGYQQSYYQKKYGQKSKKATSLAAMQAGLICTTITSPVWIVKTRMMLNTDTIAGPKNLVQTAQQIYIQYGVKGFFRGLPLSLVLSSHGVVQMTIYETLKHILDYKPERDSKESIKPLICGSASKIIATTTTFPITLIRTRIQQNQFVDGNTNLAKYKNSIDVISKTWNFEGIRGFYKGYIASLARSTPSSALFFFFFEFFKKNLPF